MRLSATCAQPEDEEAYGPHAFSVTGHHARKLIEAQYFLRLGLVPVIEIGTMATRRDGVPYAQMADILGLSESNVGVRLNRIRKALKHCISHTQ